MNTTNTHTVGEVMALASTYAAAFMRSRELSDEAPERLALLAAIERMESDREVLLEAVQKFILCCEFKSPDDESYMIATDTFSALWDDAETAARAAIQKVTK